MLKNPYLADCSLSSPWFVLLTALLGKRTTFHLTEMIAEPTLRRRIETLLSNRFKPRSIAPDQGQGLSSCWTAPTGGNFNFVRSNVTLESERREGAFIVGSIYAFDLSNLTVDGFEVSNRRPDAPRSKGVAFFRCHNLTVRDCRVRNCRGGGIAFDQSDQILCEWNIVHRNAFFNPDQHSGISVYQPQQRTADQTGLRCHHSKQHKLLQ